MVKSFSAGVSCSLAFFWPVRATLASAEIFRQARRARDRVLAALIARSFAGNLGPSKTEAHRARGLACTCISKKNAHTGIQPWRRQPAFPAQWLYSLYVAVLVTGFLATIIIGNFRFRQLDASTGASDPHDFAVRNGRARDANCSANPWRCSSLAPKLNLC